MRGKVSGALLGVVAAYAVTIAGPANAGMAVIDVTGILSNGAPLDSANEVRTTNIGAFSRVVSVAFDVTIQANSPSWLGETGVAFSRPGGLYEFVLFPGLGSQASGNVSYVGSQSLVAAGSDFQVGANGLLQLEFIETFNDSGLNPDAIWQSGTLTVNYEPGVAGVPEPGTWAMLLAGFGLAGTVARRRHRVTVAA
jgi:PEP-CTERM motif